jgi:hypothetical protein
MRAAVVRRGDLDLAVLVAPVALLARAAEAHLRRRLLDAAVGDVRLVVEPRQVMLVGPLVRLVARAAGTPVAVRVAAVGLLEELLLLAL